MKYLYYWFSAHKKISKDPDYQFIGDFITQVVHGIDPAGSEEIGKFYRHLIGEKSLININDLGAGNLRKNARIKKVGKLVRDSSAGPKLGRFLSRLVSCLDPSSVIELGTGAGISTMYMAIAAPRCRIYTIEGSSEIAALARSNIESCGIRNAEVITGSFIEKLPLVLDRIQHPLLVFIDGDHRGERLMDYFKIILPRINENSVIVLDDIRWSESMEKAWKEIIMFKEVSVSIDFFRFGILFLKKEINKCNFIIKF